MVKNNLQWLDIWTTVDLYKVQLIHLVPEKPEWMYMLSLG